MQLQKVSLKEYSSLRIGGEGNLVEVTTVEELHEAVRYAKVKCLHIHVLGGGTNTYFGEDLSSFLFIKPYFKGISFDEYEEEVRVTAAQGEIWDDLVQICVEKNLWGIENLSYIPGTVGAAPVQNIGAYGVELQEVFISLSAYKIETEEVITLTKEECHFGYRESIFKYTGGTYVIMDITLSLRLNPTPVLHYAPLTTLKEKESIHLEEIRNLVIETRKNKLPDWKLYPNAGSFFRNPVVELAVVEYVKTLYPEMPTIQTLDGYKIPAAWLIEHVANMKGARKGDIGTWPRQPLVIVNYKDGTAEELEQFITEIKEKINTKTGIVLVEEVHRVG